MNQQSLFYHDFAEQLPLFPTGKRIKTLTFQVTDACNLNCSYCYQINKCNNFMTFDIAKKMIDLLFDNRCNPGFYFWEGTTAGLEIIFIGGEPLLNFALIKEIIIYIEKRMLEDPNHSWFLFHKYLIDSNGVEFFNPEVQNFIKDFSHLIEVAITLDGNKQLHDTCRVFPNGEGSWDIVSKAALYNQKNYNKYSTKITLSPENINFTSEAIFNMLNMGFKDIQINCCFEQGWKYNHAQILFKELKQVADYIINNNLFEDIYISILNPSFYQPIDDTALNKNHCGTSDSMLAVDYKGDIYTCVRFMESSLGNDVEPYIIGNVNYGLGYTDIEKQRIDDLFLLTKKTCSSEECLNCLIGGGCSYCTAYCYQENKTIFSRTTYHCEMMKASALASQYLDFKANNLNNFQQLLPYSFVSSIINKEEYDLIFNKKEV